MKYCMMLLFKKQRFYKETLKIKMVKGLHEKHPLQITLIT
jgi:hypothetical protein